MLDSSSYNGAGKSRGIRNNNPGNIRAGSPWRGAEGVDSAGFVIFDTVENGLRAMAKLLINYQRIYGLSTIRGIISRWAPTNENDTESYIRSVSWRMGRKENERLSYPADLRPLMEAIIYHENGSQPYDVAVIGEGISRAVA